MGFGNRIGDGGAPEHLIHPLVGPMQDCPGVVLSAVVLTPPEEFAPDPGSDWALMDVVVSLDKVH